VNIKCYSSKELQEIAQAEATLACAEDKLKTEKKRLFLWWRKNYPEVLLGGGLLGGLALTLLPIKVWGRIGTMAGSTFSRLARSFLAPLMAGLVLAKLQSRDRKLNDTKP